MGRIATIAEQHWRKHLPAAYAAIKDRAAFFQELEDEAEDQIATLAEALEGRPETFLARVEPRMEGFLEQAGRLRQARAEAEQTVLREMVLIDPALSEAQFGPDRQAGQADPETPEDRKLTEAIRGFAAAREELMALTARSGPRTPPSPLKA